jgi:hypothetical protein
MACAIGGENANAKLVRPGAEESDFALSALIEHPKAAKEIRPDVPDDYALGRTNERSNTQPYEDADVAVSDRCDVDVNPLIVGAEDHRGGDRTPEFSCGAAWR